MKKLLPIVLILFFGQSVLAQVGIGTDMPKESAQLEVVSSSRGVLIPQIALTSNTDRTTITAGNLESLLVYNTATNATLSPGYYYWYQGSWNRMISSEDLSQVTDILTDNGDGTFTHTAVDGTEVLFDANTTVFTDNGDGTYTFTNANGDTMTIDVVNDIITNITNQGDIYNEIINLIAANETLTVLIDNGDGTFTYTNEEGDVITFDANTTSLIDNGNGSYTLTNANGQTITIDVVNDVVTNITNEGDIYDAIVNLIESVSVEETTTTLVDNGDGTFTYTNEEGDVITFDANTTSLTDNGNGSYTLTNANGQTITIDIVNDVINNITSQGDIYNEIINLIAANETLTVLTDNGDGTFTYTDENGDDVLFDANTTSLIDNGNGSYTLTNANGQTITIDVVNDVVTNITNEGDIYDAIVNLIESLSVEETTTTLVDNGDGTFTYTNEEGDVITFDANTTSLIDNGNGSYTLTNANGQTITIDVVNDLINNITSQGDIYNEIINLIAANETLTVLTDNGDGTFTYTNEEGDVITFDANTTSLIDNGNGSYTLTNANGQTITIDVVNDVINNITSQGDIYNEIINLIAANETLTVLTDNGDGTFTYTDENGDDVLFDANTTSLIDNGNGSYTLTNANGQTITIDVVNDVVTNILSQGAIYDEIISLLENAPETLTELTYDPASNSLIYKDETGFSHTLPLNSTDLTYDPATRRVVYINSLGQVQEINLDILVGDLLEPKDLISDSSITVTDGLGATLTDTQIKVAAGGIDTEHLADEAVTADKIKAGNPGEVLITDSGGNAVWVNQGDLITHIAAGNTTIVSGSGTEADPYVIDIEPGSDNTILITDDQGNISWESLEDVIQDNQKTTTVTGEGLIEVTPATSGSNTEYVVRTKTPGFFYMPAVIFNTSENGTATRDLYQDYVNQFSGAAHHIDHGVSGGSIQYTGGLIGSQGAPAAIEVYESNELYYYITYYDQNVFENLSISADGKLTYTVKNTATQASYMNIVFVVKE